MHPCQELDKLPRIPAEKVKKALTRASDTTAFRLRDTVIEGDLDLRNCQVTRPVEFHGFHFCGKVDLRHSDFHQVVDFSRCVFHNALNSGDRHHTRAIYRKDLICTDATFKGLVSFNRAYVEGHALFAEARFERVDENGCAKEVEGAADFSGMQIERNFICNWAVFERGVSFNALHCRTGEFHGTRFESEKEVDFRSAHFRGNIEFEDRRVEARYVEDGSVDPSEHGNRPGPIVLGKLNLRGFTCDRRAIFSGVDFAGEVDCEDATFGWYLDCRGARFRNKALFIRTRCDGAGFFRDAFFEFNGVGSAADFRYACFESLELSRAVFCGRVTLGQTRIEEKLRLDETRFHNDVQFYGARIGTIVLLQQGFKFSNLMRLPQQAVDGPASAAHNERAADYDAMRATLGARCDSGKAPEKEDDVRRWLEEKVRNNDSIRAMVTNCFFPFRGGDEFCQGKKDEPCQGTRDGIRPRKKERTWSESRLNARWTQGWSFLPGPFRITIDPEPAPRGVELDGCVFSRIHAGPVSTIADELIRAFAASQKIDRYSRDVYLQLERFYSQAGDEERARDAHLWGHLATRRNAFTRGGTVRWSLTQKAGDSLLMLTGWGLQTWRIWFACLLIVLGATLCFATMDDMLRVESEPDTTISGVIPGVGEVVLNQSAQASGESPASGTADSGILPDCFGEGPRCWLQRAGYSLTTFIPAISLGLDRGWEPANGLSEGVRIGLVLLGWLFVPLGVGAMTGIIRSDRT